jgi:hypothetical protein
MRELLIFLILLGANNTASAQSCRYVSNQGDVAQFTGDKVRITSGGNSELCDTITGPMGRQIRCGEDEPIDYSFVSKFRGGRFDDILTMNRAAFYKTCSGVSKSVK